MNNHVMRKPMQVTSLQSGVPGPNVHKVAGLENELGQDDANAKE